MAYEVTKLVNGRPYRYRVQSERDPATGKSRNRWTYLGRAEPGTETPPRKPRRNAREALLDALERLLNRTDPGDLTAGAVSAEAGLAHGTFYRYFRNRTDAVRALAERLRGLREEALRALDEPPADAAAARRALREWSGVFLGARSEHPGLVRALLALAARDPEVRALLLERRAFFERKLGAWLRDVGRRGIVERRAAAAAEAMLFPLIDGIGRDAVAAGNALDEREVEAAIDLVERAVFGVLR